MPSTGQAETFNQPCTQCGLRMAVRNWSYVYGRIRRGINPRTLEDDYRPLGTDKVYLCRSCEWSVLRVRIRQLVPQHPLQVLAAVGALAGLVTGARRLDLITELVILGAIVAWVALTWALRRRKPMCKAIFLHLRRAKLSEAHGLNPSELEPYLEEVAA